MFIHLLLENFHNLNISFFYFSKYSLNSFNLQGGLLFRGRFLSLKRLKKRYELLSIPGRYRFAGKEEGAEPIDVEYKADEDELKLIRKIRYKLKFEHDKIGN